MRPRAPRSKHHRRLRGRLARAAALALVACGDASGPDADPAGGDPREVRFRGICDASAAIALTERLFAVADDEDSTLRVYDADRGGEPVRSVDLSDALFPPEERAKKRKGGKKKARKGAEQAVEGAPAEARPRRAPESDIEAAVRLGDVAYWMTSHARNRDGERKDARLLFFATTASDGNDALRLVGRAYEQLLDDLLEDARYAHFELAAASELAPKEPGGLNLEGLGERAEGGVWIGFRNPIPGGRALLAPLLNPAQLVLGERARLGEPVLLDLGGLGIRDLSHWRGRTLIVAGPYAQGEASRLFTWDGSGRPLEVTGLDLSDFHPEGFFAVESRDEILLLSDDGSVESDGEECKRQDDPSRKSFRGRWISLPPPGLPGGRGGASAKIGRTFSPGAPGG
jgi:hypothetical protein